MSFPSSLARAKSGLNKNLCSLVFWHKKLKAFSIFFFFHFHFLLSTQKNWWIGLDFEGRHEMFFLVPAFDAMASLRLLLLLLLLDR